MSPLLAVAIHAAVAQPLPHEESRCLEITSTNDRDVIALQRLRTALQEAAPCIVVAGDFLLPSSIRIGSSNHGLRLASSDQRPARFIAMAGVTRGIEVSKATNVHIEGVELTGFTTDGIFAADTPFLTIRFVVVRAIKSSGWSQGAIHLTGTVSNSVIEKNVVDGSDYAGIIVDTNGQSDVSNVSIEHNQVRHTCRAIADCGAIYINDRGKRSSGIHISNNDIADFGTSLTSARAIYLDDWLSHSTVSNNKIVGPGRFAFQIHGGRDNKIEGNVVDMRRIDNVIAYESIGPLGRQNMIGNVLRYNLFVKSFKEQLIPIEAGKPATLGVLNIVPNRWCYTRNPQNACLPD